MPFLHGFENKYASKEVLVLGVHSPKFDNEKSLENIAKAMIRHEILHPVCNDSELKLWNYLSISCWPTITIIGPNGELLFFIVGEKAIQNYLELYVDVCLEYFTKKKQLNLNKKHLLPIVLLKDQNKENSLNYPTKLALSPDETKLSIANTLSNSIIISTNFGYVEFIIGSNCGFKDGSFEHASFNYPQGMAWFDNNTIYVCDTGNNAIRKIDLISKNVETIAEHLNSPWDIIYSSNDNRLYIAMPGFHQIWTIILSKQGDIVNNTHHPFGSCICFAGDGEEKKRNHRSLLKSSFAQPTGLTLNSNAIYVADSESSSIRIIDLLENSVSTLIGGSFDPSDLFAFGDIDGIGKQCRLQHCMGVCTFNADTIFVADTFNHKVCLSLFKLN